MSDSIPTPKCAKGAGAPLSLPAKPKRRRGGQPGNLNATKYTWRALARRGHLVRAEDRWVLPAMEQYKRELESDKPDATANISVWPGETPRTRPESLTLAMLGAAESQAICVGTVG